MEWVNSCFLFIISPSQSSQDQTLSQNLRNILGSLDTNEDLPFVQFQVTALQIEIYEMYSYYSVVMDTCQGPSDIFMASLHASYVSVPIVAIIYSRAGKIAFFV